MNAAGLDLIKRFEGLRLKAYLCPAGKLTVGYGHTGPDVTDGLQISIELAEELLASDAAVAARAVETFVKVPVTDNQFDVLVSFVFNVGAKRFGESTLLRKLNAGDYAAVPVELMRWVKSGDRVIKGLVSRRRAEADLWVSP